MNRPAAVVSAMVLLVALLLSPLPNAATARTPANALELEALHAHLPDIDTRNGLVLPSQQQLDDVAALGADATWTRFGTPQSLIKYGDYLASGLSGDAATVARGWVRANRNLFRLSDQAVTNLELVNAVALDGTSAHVVLFRERYGNLTAVQDGMISVAVDGDKVAYVSSSAAGDAPNPGSATLSPLQAWVKAATNAGFSVSLPNLSNQRSEYSWTVFDVLGFSEPQRARLRALAIPGAGARAVFEANVVKVDLATGEAEAYISLVDAQSGQVLFRQNRVQYAEARQLGLPQTFSGSYATTLPKCGPRHTFAVASGTTRIVVTATATIPANDITLSLIRASDSTLLATQDTATSPETLTYTPSGGISAGNYSVLVCEASNANATVPPTSYTGTFSADSLPVPNPLAYPPKWKYFQANPPLDYSSSDTRVVGCWEKSVNGSPVPGCTTELRNLAARATWDYAPRANAPSFTTIGNAANSSQAWLSPLTPAEQYRPVSASREYNYPWTNQWYNEKCATTVFASAQRNDIDAAVTNLFAMHNRMHDWSYFLGFTEQTYNAQDSNFGNTTPDRENDPEVGNAQAGAVSGGAPSYLGRDNANQITLQDGIPPITNMYLWQPIAAAFYPACVDGDYDMSIIGHEYTHLISNRMVGGPDSSLSGNQAGAMGESWSDLSAVEYLNEYGFVPTNGENPFAVGAYVTGNKQTGIRNYSMDKNPLVYGNFGYDLACNSDDLGNCTADSEFHSDAEIWDGVNFDIRQALINKYNGSFSATNRSLQVECADGKRQASQCPGNRRWIQLVFDAFLLMQPAVTFLDARDAYLAADMLRFGGANQKELWNAFAKRGMGQYASTSGSEDVNPLANYESPFATEATVTFNPVAGNEGNTPISGAQIFVGRYEARGTPIADTDGATALGASAKFVPGSYEFAVRAPGYGLLRVTANFTAGANQTLTIKMPTNLASSSKGATISGDGVNLGKLIDDTENTTWARLNAPTNVNGTAVVVDLSGGARKVTHVQVSAMQRLENPDDASDAGSQSRFSALRGFEIWACNADIAANQNCANPGNFSRIYTSAADAFPGVAPRPTAPTLIMRKFDVPDTTATHIKLVVLTNQCSGTAAFQGETDNDPLNDTDCTTSAAALNVRAAELQVFSW